MVPGLHSDGETLETQRKQKFDYSPLISIAVPAYQTPVNFLRQMIESLIVQTYSNWELCIVNASPDNEEMQKYWQNIQPEIPR